MFGFVFWFLLIFSHIFLRIYTSVCFVINFLCFNIFIFIYLICNYGSFKTMRNKVSVEGGCFVFVLFKLTTNKEIIIIIIIHKNNNKIQLNKIRFVFF